MSSLNLPWVVIGDLDAIMSSSQHRGDPHYYYSSKPCLFSYFINSTNLLDVDNYVGLDYTWCNNKSSLARWWA